MTITTKSDGENHVSDKVSKDYTSLVFFSDIEPTILSNTDMCTDLSEDNADLFCATWSYYTSDNYLEPHT